MSSLFSSRKTCKESAIHQDDWCWRCSQTDNEDEICNDCTTPFYMEVDVMVAVQELKKELDDSYAHTGSISRVVAEYLIDSTFGFPEKVISNDIVMSEGITNPGQSGEERETATNGYCP